MRRAFLPEIYPGFVQVAAIDTGDKLRLVRPAEAAQQFANFDDVATAWQYIDQQMDTRLAALNLVGTAPFWFLDCDDWPSSAFLCAPRFLAWARQRSGANRPLMAAAFSSEQLLIGYADSAEFHDRLGHVRSTPMQRPLMALPLF